VQLVIRVLVVDDHPVVRQGLVSVLSDHDDLDVVGSAGSGFEAVAMVETLRPEVVLLDLEMPEMGGVQALPQILGASPGVHVLVFTAYATDDRVFGAIRAGAGGYLLKGASTAEIVQAIRAVAAGESYLEPRVAARLVAEVSAPRLFTLTERERSVLRLVAAGLPNKQIARSLSISERTVKFHVTSILHKLGAENRTQAVTLAIERGLL
jgi:DNA-binding NarL/FixJ family response regulator